jgi:hypothetical protein
MDLLICYLLHHRRYHIHHRENLDYPGRVKVPFFLILQRHHHLM